MSDDKALTPYGEMLIALEEIIAIINRLPHEDRRKLAIAISLLVAP